MKFFWCDIIHHNIIVDYVKITVFFKMTNCDIILEMMRRFSFASDMFNEQILYFDISFWKIRTNTTMKTITITMISSTFNPVTTINNKNQQVFSPLILQEQLQYLPPGSKFGTTLGLWVNVDDADSTVPLVYSIDLATEFDLK